MWNPSKIVHCPSTQFRFYAFITSYSFRFYSPTHFLKIISSDTYKCPCFFPIQCENVVKLYIVLCSFDFQHSKSVQTWAIEHVQALLYESQTISFNRSPYTNDMESSNTGALYRTYGRKHVQDVTMKFQFFCPARKTISCYDLPVLS